MNFKNLFRRTPAYSGAHSGKKSSAAAPLLVSFGIGHPRFTPRRYDHLAEEGFQKNIVAYRAVRLVAQNAAATHWNVYSVKGAEKIKLSDHPLVTLLQRPNPVQGGAELFESLYSFFLIAGNSYIEGNGSYGVAPTELWTLRPDRMRVIPGPGGVPEAYRYEINGQKYDFHVDAETQRSRVLHIKSFHPLDDWYGMSPLEAAAVSIDQHNDAAKWNASLLQAGGRPSGALVYRPANPDSGDQLTDEQRRVLKDELEKYFSGPDNAGRPLVLEGGLDWREMALSPKDMDWLAGKDVSAREIALAFHVPPQLIGIEGALTFANMEQARLALYDDAVLPLLDRVKDALNNWLAPQFGDDIAIDYDIDSIEALIPRREKNWARISGASFLTLNEKRRLLNLPPLAEGDQIVPIPKSPLTP